MNKVWHVVAGMGGGWAVRPGGAGRATRSFSEEKDAVAFARDLAKRDDATLFVHRADGSVRSREQFPSGEIVSARRG
jgi:hypothetical protein